MSPSFARTCLTDALWDWYTHQKTRAFEEAAFLALRLDQIEHRGLTDEEIEHDAEDRHSRKHSNVTGFAPYTVYESGVGAARYYGA